MEKVLLFGGSAEAIKLCIDNGHEITAVVDPSEKKKFPEFQLIHSDDEALRSFSGLPAIVAIDNCLDRERVFSFLKKMRVRCLSIVGGTLHSPESEGMFMQINSFISSNVTIGKGLRLNYGATVMHDCFLGDFVTLAPNCTLLGGVVIGDCSYVGASATVLPQVKIGKNCLVGAGSVVTKDVPDNAKVRGVPAS